MVLIKLLNGTVHSITIFALYTVTTRPPGDAGVGFAPSGLGGMFRECSANVPLCKGLYIGDQEMGGFLRNR